MNSYHPRHSNCIQMCSIQLLVYYSLCHICLVGGREISRDKGPIIYIFLSPRSSLFSNRQSLTTQIYSISCFITSNLKAVSLFIFLKRFCAIWFNLLFIIHKIEEYSVKGCCGMCCIKELSFCSIS